MDNKKRFEDYPIECNTCEMYYTNRCDGVNMLKNEQKGTCNSFLPVRNVTIPQEIKKAQEGIKRLEFGFLILAVMFLLDILVRL